MLASRSRATSAVRRSTAPTTTSRCQSGMRLSFDISRALPQFRHAGLTPGPSPGPVPPGPVRSVQRQGLTAGVALVGAVPERDLGLAELPAEQDDAAAVLAREVDQAAVEVLHLHAEALQLLEHRHELRGGLLHLGGDGCDVGRRESAAV